MTQPRKYEGISDDLDTAPDVYETPDLTDDVSTLPASSVPRPSSAGSSYEDASEGELVSGISRARLQPNKAREQFYSNDVDAREVDFSDRVSSKRKSYRTSRRQRRTGGTRNEDEALSDEDESLEQKLARLRREVEEVKAEYDKSSNEPPKDAAQDASGTAANGVHSAAELSRALDELNSAQRSKSRASISSIQRQDRDFDAATVTDQESKGATSTRHTKFTVEYAPNYEEAHALAKAADIDSRLALLEKHIGRDSSSVPSTGNAKLPNPILPALETLEQQLTTLSTATPSSLDAVSRQIHDALQEAERLDELRKQARATQEAARQGGATRPTQPSAGQQPGPSDESEQGAKINALFGTLPKIENLAPLLPSVLDRLHTLRAVHTNAARASESLDAVEARQQEMTEDIKRWREGLEKLEKSMKGAEEVREGNLKVVEGWVKDLEERMKRTE
ncbi:MAG: hypothetical protein M1822_002477 [Bathelium mastoideum]|nr:MAG: hypothetical protein M1822_002477 [Bathelium mastoideum]